MWSNPKQERIESRQHRMFVASLPCCVSLVPNRTQCAHIRTGNNAGMGFKSNDTCCVPLSIEEHEKQGKGEKAYWGATLSAAQTLAKDLYANTGDMVKGRALIKKFHDVWLWDRIGK